MKKTLLLLAIGLGLASCGSDDSGKSSENQSLLEGVWSRTTEIEIAGDKMAIVETYDFLGDRFMRNLFAVSTINGVQITHHEGKFTVSDTIVTFVPTRSSCATYPQSESTFTVEKKTLDLDGTEFETRDERLAEPTANTGCAVGTEWFPSPVKEL